MPGVRGVTAADLSGQQDDPSLHVRLPPQGLPGGIIAALAIGSAVILFLVLNAQRTERAVAPRRSPQAETFVAPPPLNVPPDIQPPAAPVTVVTSPLPSSPATGRALPPVVVAPLPSSPVIVPVLPETTPPPVFPDTAEGPRRPASPALVIDMGPDTRPSSVTGPNQSAGNQARGQGQGAAGDDAPVRATSMISRTSTVPVGTMIPIVLETPIDTARAGLVRAIASRETRGFDGQRVLIPRGSRLIGEYQADVRSGQNRVLVNWTRLIRPDGTSIRLGSPAADQLGGAGVPGQVHSYFLQRFASAVLQSALTVGVNIASRPRAGSVVVGLPTGPITTVGQGLLPGSDLRPKITVKQGALLNVFVARDLDFSGAGSGQQ